MTRHSSPIVGAEAGFRVQFQFQWSVSEECEDASVQTFNCICEQLSPVFVDNFQSCMWTTFTCICEQLLLVFLWKAHVMYACKILTKPKGL